MIKVLVCFVCRLDFGLIEILNTVSCILLSLDFVIYVIMRNEATSFLSSTSTAKT